MVVYDKETFDTIKCVPCVNCIYKRGKVSGKYNRDIIEKHYRKSLNDCFVFKGLDNINGMIDLVFSFKGEPKNVKKNVG